MVQQKSSEVLDPRQEPAAIITKQRPQLTKASIEAITYDLKMAEQLVFHALEPGIDFGRTPGTPTDGLWDPGTAKIINAFECYPRHKVLFHEEGEKVITWVIEAELVHRGTQLVMGTGVGVCSTREPKYKYRWYTREEALAFPIITEADVDSAKSRKGTGKNSGATEYRLENPEYGEQVNTILQMAAKRSETDGVKTLPGVSSALRKMFDPKWMAETGRRSRTDEARRIVEGGKEDEKVRWTSFWNGQRDLLGEGYQDKTHRICGVQSMAEWLKKGKSLEDATRLTIQKIEAGEVPGVKKWDIEAVTEDDIRNVDDLVAAAKACFGWEEKTLWAEANYSGRKNFKEAGVETPWAVFNKLRAQYQADRLFREPE